MLTERQKKFVDAYSGRGSGLAAARAAGYRGDDRTLRVAAAKLLRVPNVAAAIESKTGVPQPPARVRKDPRIADHVEQQRLLTRIARDKEVEVGARIRAIGMLSRIQTSSELLRTRSSTTRIEIPSSPDQSPVATVVFVANGRGPLEVPALELRDAS